MSAGKSIARSRNGLGRIAVVAGTIVVAVLLGGIALFRRSAVRPPESDTVAALAAASGPSKSRCKYFYDHASAELSVPSEVYDGLEMVGWKKFNSYSMMQALNNETAFLGFIRQAGTDTGFKREKYNVYGTAWTCAWYVTTINPNGTLRELVRLISLADDHGEVQHRALLAVIPNNSDPMPHWYPPPNALGFTGFTADTSGSRGGTAWFGLLAEILDAKGPWFPCSSNGCCRVMES